MMFECHPVPHARIVVETRQFVKSVRDVWTCGDGDVVYCSNSIGVRDVLHLASFFVILW